LKVEGSGSRDGGGGSIVDVELTSEVYKIMQQLHPVSSLDIDIYQGDLLNDIEHLGG
jgi:hypothetical protein